MNIRQKEEDWQTADNCTDTLPSQARFGTWSQNSQDTADLHIKMELGDDLPGRRKYLLHTQVWRADSEPYLWRPDDPNLDRLWWVPPHWPAELESWKDWTPVSQYQRHEEAIRSACSPEVPKRLPHYILDLYCNHRSSPFKEIIRTSQQFPHLRKDMEKAIEFK